MKKLIILFLLGSSFAYGQRNLTLTETVFGPRTYAPKSLYAQQWIPNTNTFTYIDSDFKSLSSRSEKNNWQASKLITLEDLQKSVSSILPENEKIRLSMIPLDYDWLDAKTLQFAVSAATKNYHIQYQVDKKQAHVLAAVPAEAKNIAYTADYSRVAYLKDNNLYYAKSDGQEIAITQDSSEAIVNGSDYTHRQEFGIDRGTWWSADNKKILYYRKDEQMVTKYPLIQWADRIATVKNIAYPMAGMKSEEVTLVIYDSETGKKTTLQTGEPKEQYLTICSWDPNSEYVYVGVLNREQNHLKLNKYSATTGAYVSTLFEEKSDSWVEPQHALLFLPTKDDTFLYQSDRDGYNQLYLYSSDGKLQRKLGYQDVIVEDIKGINSKGTKISYLGVTNNGLDRQLFEVDITSGETTQLTQESATHNAALSSDGKFLYDEYSSLTVANNISVKNLKNQKTQQILTAENPFAGQIDLPKIEAISLLAADGKTPLNGRIIYPTNFDANKKYPVMFYLYGGSHAQLVQNKWLYGAGYFDLYMAQQGYIVFTMDNRGSDARGRDFTRVTHRNLGVEEMADQLKGVEFLKSKSFVDQSNMGIFGWSFGGFMTTFFMIHQPELFKTGVAGGPVMDWKYYEVMYGERYMDMPQENPEGYEKTNLVNKAAKLQGNLLVIHGAQDPVVVQQHSMAFIEACIKAGKQVDYFLYPSHEHNVSGKDRIHMYEKIAKYFDLHLKGQ